jgi:hypothetical protein
MPSPWLLAVLVEFKKQQINVNTVMCILKVSNTFIKIQQRISMSYMFLNNYNAITACVHAYVDI